MQALAGKAVKSSIKKELKANLPKAPQGQGARLRSEHNTISRLRIIFISKLLSLCVMIKKVYQKFCWKRNFDAV